MTGKVDYKSDLKRKAWMREGMVQAASDSFWNGLIGNSSDSVVHMAKNGTAKSGHTVVFQSRGNLSGKAVKGKDTAYGKGEQKRTLSSKITVDRYRLVVDNGDEFDAVDIDDLSITQHQDSRSGLSDLHVRFKDQGLFDAGQGLRGQSPSHIFDLGSKLDYNVFLDIMNNVKTSKGFTTGGTRRPLDHYRMNNGPKAKGAKGNMKKWLFIVDSDMATMLMKSEGWQNMTRHADIRGEGNRLIACVIGTIGNLMVATAPTFFGETDGGGSGANVHIPLNASEIEISGLRQRDGAGLWTGQEGFSAAGELYSRGLLLGANAFQLAYGKQPDYKLQPSIDFGINTESCCEFWTNSQKTVLELENSKEYKQAKIADIDFGCIAVDLKVRG
ncbi:MAG: DUF4043 family protein [Gammaproteobacteria bacterium]|nr:DUF4043 family protein [Gammaproteobacteria bacterium]